jgi:hypothetical protein
MFEFAVARCLHYSSIASQEPFIGQPRYSCIFSNAQAISRATSEQCGLTTILVINLQPSKAAGVSCIRANSPQDGVTTAQYSSELHTFFLKPRRFTFTGYYQRLLVTWANLISAPTTIVANKYHS